MGGGVRYFMKMQQIEELGISSYKIWYHCSEVHSATYQILINK